MTSKGRGGRRYAPYAFTEQGVAMLSSVLRTKRAVLVNVEIIRAFFWKTVTEEPRVAPRLQWLARRSRSDS